MIRKKLPSLLKQQNQVIEKIRLNSRIPHSILHEATTPHLNHHSNNWYVLLTIQIMIRSLSIYTDLRV